MNANRRKVLLTPAPVLTTTRGHVQMATPDNTTKRCCTCKETKSIDDFHSDTSQQDKHSARCKVCKLRGNKEYLATEKGRAARVRSFKKYMTTDPGRNVKAQSAKRMYEIYPEKQFARDQIYHAVKNGTLPKAAELICVDCGSPAQEYHHPDYSQPMLIIPLCRPCHVKVHKQ